MVFLKVGFWILFGTVWCQAKLVHFHQSPPNDGNELVYGFGYAIDDPVSGVVTDRWEEKRAGVVKGAYSLVEPGGSVRSVDYQVDGSGGFRAVVRTSRPGFYFLSTQEFRKSNELHRQPSPELKIPVPSPLPPPGPGVPVNYHAINAEILGFQKLFGKRVEPRNFYPPALNGIRSVRQPTLRRTYRY